MLRVPVNDGNNVVPLASTSIRTLALLSFTRNNVPSLRLSFTTISEFPLLGAVTLNLDVGTAVPKPTFPLEVVEIMVPPVPTFNTCVVVMPLTFTFPLTFMLVDVIFVIIPVIAVTAVPVKLPENVVAVTVPITCKLVAGAISVEPMPIFPEFRNNIVPFASTSIKTLALLSFTRNTDPSLRLSFTTIRDAPVVVDATDNLAVGSEVPIPKLPLEGIKVKLEVVIPIEVVEALETKVINCGILEVDVEIPPEEVQEIPAPVEMRIEPAAPT